MTDCPDEQALRALLQGNLAPPEQDAVEAHIEACTTCSERLQQLHDAITVVGRRQGAAEPFPVASSCETLLNLAGRYEVRGRIGRGGMGEVFQGRDRDLGRDLALKVLLPGHSDQRRAAERFREEAQIAGQLQHPGVVPVHELGQLADGRPFFTMKLVKGQTLAKLLHERHSPDHDRARFLKVFEQVCQTVAYAHSRGVIHRDLKPGNVMVGAFGEVLVMDWGLAKVLGRETPLPTVADTSGEQTRSVIQVNRTDFGSDTREGDVLGTPAYMAPEQALGEIDRLDERCDVFSLGAILCEVLTGKPPYADGNGQEILRKARRAELEDALERLDGCAADAEVIALAKCCLMPEKDGRPRTASMVASAIETYLAGVEERARHAELERAAAQAREEEANVTAAAERARAMAERRARRLALGLTTVTLLLVVAGGVGGWMLLRHRLETEQQVQLALMRGGELLKQGWEEDDASKLNEARMEANRAVESSIAGGKRFRDQAETFRQEVTARLGQADKNRTLLLALLDIVVPRETASYRADDKEGMRMAAITQPSVEAQYSAAFRRWGGDPSRDPEAETIARFAEQPQRVVQEIVAGLDNWVLQRGPTQLDHPELRRLLRLADQLDRNETRHQLRVWLSRVTARHDVIVAELTRVLLPATALCELERGRFWQRILPLRARPVPATESVLTFQMLSHIYYAKEDTAEAERVLRLGLTAWPDQVVLHETLGRLLGLQKRWTEAIECFRAARALRPGLGIHLAQSLREAGRLEEGEAVLIDLARRQPNNPEVHFYLGGARFHQRRLAEGAASYRKAIELNPDYAEAYSDLGNTLRELQNLEEAAAALRKAIALKPNLAEVYNNLGCVLFDQEKWEEAVAALRKAIALKPNFATGYHNLGAALQAQDKPSEAATAFYKAIELQGDFADSYSRLGIALLKQRKPEEAIAVCRKAIALRPDLAEAYTTLGGSLHAQGKLAEAITAYRKVIALNPDFAKGYYNLGVALLDQKKPHEAAAAHRRAIELQPGLAEAHSSLGATLLSLNKLSEAVAVCRQAIALKPDLAAAHYNLGTALHLQNKLDEAVAAYRKAIALQSNYALAYSNLGSILADQQKLEEALSACRQAIGLHPENPLTYMTLGHVLSQQQKVEEAIAAYRKAIAFKPDYAEVHLNLGLLLRREGRFNDALSSLKRGHDLGVKDSTWQHPSLKWVRECERWVELDALLSQVLEGKAKPASAAEQVRLAQLCQGYRQRPAAAVRFYKAAFTEAPAFATDLQRQHRYNAACSAALAAAGRGQDALKLSETDRVALRRQALDWLLADLAAYGKLLEKPSAAQKQALRQLLSHWREDPDLSAIRDDKALAALPEAERKRWQQLWADVAELLKKTDNKD